MLFGGRKRAFTFMSFTFWHMLIELDTFTGFLFEKYLNFTFFFL